MDDRTNEIFNQILDIEGLELEQLTKLVKITHATKPEIYEIIKEPLIKIILDTIEHATEMHDIIIKLRMGLNNGVR